MLNVAETTSPPRDRGVIGLAVALWSSPRRGRSRRPEGNALPTSSPPHQDVARNTCATLIPHPRPSGPPDNLQRSRRRPKLCSVERRGVPLRPLPASPRRSALLDANGVQGASPATAGLAGLLLGGGFDASRRSSGSWGILQPPLRFAPPRSPGVVDLAPSCSTISNCPAECKPRPRYVLDGQSEAGCGRSRVAGNDPRRSDSASAERDRPPPCRRRARPVRLGPPSKLRRAPRISR